MINIDGQAHSNLTTMDRMVLIYENSHSLEIPQNSNKYEFLRTHIPPWCATTAATFVLKTA